MRDLCLAACAKAGDFMTWCLCNDECMNLRAPHGFLMLVQTVCIIRADMHHFM